MTASSVIEIIGPAGIGKSTLCKALLHCPSHNDQVRLLSVAQLLSIPRLKSPKLLHELVQRFLFSNNNAEPSRLLYRRRSLSGVIRDASSEEWRRFIDICLDGASKDNRPAENRLLGMSFIHNTIATRLYIDLFAVNGSFVLMDEPLGYRPSMFNPKEVVPSPMMENYYEAMPLPGALIHISGNVDTVVERVVKRRYSGHCAHRHKGLSECEIREDTKWAACLADYGVQVMKDRGVPVLGVNAEDDLPISLKKSIEFIKHLGRTRTGS